jgi:4-hydroxy-tetrahydrodipicolinate synthase
MKACFWETNPIPIKTILAMKGDCKEVFRLPMTPMTAENREKLSKLLQEKDLI